MTDLQKALEFTKNINDMKQNAIRNKTYYVQYTDIFGKTRNEYYYSLRWHDRPSTINQYNR